MAGLSASAEHGSFAFTGLPAGSYRLSASYTGLDPQEVTVDLRPGSGWSRPAGPRSIRMWPGSWKGSGGKSPVDTA